MQKQIRHRTGGVFPRAAALGVDGCAGGTGGGEESACGAQSRPKTLKRRGTKQTQLKPTTL